MISWLLSMLFPLRPTVWQQKVQALGDSVPRYTVTAPVATKQWHTVEKWKKTS